VIRGFKDSVSHDMYGEGSLYYKAEGGVIELPETGAPYAPHVKAKIT